MERYEVEDDGRFSDLIHAVRRGDEVVVTQGGEAVATVVPSEPNGKPASAMTSVDPGSPSPLRTRDGGEPGRGINVAALRALHDSLPPASRGRGAATIRELRDMGY